MSSQSFSEIERQAQVAEKLREQQVADAKKQAEESMCVSAREAPAYMGLGGQAGQVRMCAELWLVRSLEGLPPCVWPTRSSRLTVRRRRRSYRTWKGRSESRPRGWAWDWCPEGEAQLWGAAGKCHCSPGNPWRFFLVFSAQSSSEAEEMALLTVFKCLV